MNKYDHPSKIFSITTTTDVLHMEGGEISKTCEVYSNTKFEIDHTSYRLCTKGCHDPDMCSEEYHLEDISLCTGFLSVMPTNSYTTKMYYAFQSCMYPNTFIWIEYSNIDRVIYRVMNPNEVRKKFGIIVKPRPSHLSLS